MAVWWVFYLQFHLHPFWELLDQNSFYNMSRGAELYIQHPAHVELKNICSMTVDCLNESQGVPEGPRRQDQGLGEWMQTVWSGLLWYFSFVFHRGAGDALGSRSQGL